MRDTLALAAGPGAWPRKRLGLADAAALHERPCDRDGGAIRRQLMSPHAGSDRTRGAQTQARTTHAGPGRAPSYGSAHVRIDANAAVWSSLRWTTSQRPSWEDMP